MKQIAALLCLSALPALAQGTYPSGKAVECYCTDKTGKRVELGQSICLEVGGRRFIAQCQMSLNVPMWREIQQGCHSSSLRNLPDPGQNPLQPVFVDAHV